MANGNGSNGSNGRRHRREGRPGAREDRREGPRLAGVDLDLPARLDLPAGLHRQPPQPLLRDHEQRAVPPSPGEGEAARGEGVSYTLCLGGLSFFLFILLTVTGIFLMFFYRPTAAAGVGRRPARCETAVTFGSLVRNMHRWAAHLMVLTVFLHMAASSTTAPTRRRVSSTG